MFDRLFLQDIAELEIRAARWHPLPLEKRHEPISKYCPPELRYDYTGKRSA